MPKFRIIAKTFLTLFIIFIIINCSYYFKFHKLYVFNIAFWQNKAVAPTLTLEKEDLFIDSTPITINIPKLNIKANIISLGLDDQNNISVPTSFQEVGWYNLDGYPGNSANLPTILVGHYAAPEFNINAIFNQLYTLNKDDNITITNKTGTNFEYKVTSNIDYMLSEIPMESLVSSDSTDRIVIITCGGKWSDNNYNKRTVVVAVKTN